jgi:23S rRNA G2445 N2-methylase RlmL
VQGQQRAHVEIDHDPGTIVETIFTSGRRPRKLGPALPRRPLPESLRDPGFTPRAKDLDALVDLLADDELRRHVERAIVRLGAAAVEGLKARLASSEAPLRARIVRVMGRLAQDDRAAEALRAALDDGDAKTRRNAAMALGRGRAAGAEDELLRTWETDARPEMRRTVAASLGKVGTARSLPLLREASRAADAELARIALRAAMMIERTESRDARGRIDASRAPPVPVDVLGLCRRGLDDLLVDELRAVTAVSDVRAEGPGRVRARLAGPMVALFSARTMLGFRFPLATEWVAEGDEPKDAIARALTGEAARAIFAAWTEGAVRYRIAWADGGHKRGATWSVADAVARRSPELVNDPTASLWEAVVETRGRFVDVSLSPRALEDPRFAWRRGDVPAASHPTIAAALARVAGTRDDDVVWDPFVGSGAELVERWRLGPFATLLGSDLDQRALAVARANFAAAGVHASLQQGDAQSLSPRGVTLVVTNPPMGRRASRAAGLADALDRFVAHAAEVLVPGGRLVWITPWARRARVAAERAGLRLAWARAVDMGGFDAELQRWDRP